MGNNTLLRLLPLLPLTLGFALAQTAPAQPPTQPPAQQAPATQTPAPSGDLRELQRQARELTLLSQVQPADRQALQTLLNERAALQQAARAMHETHLRAYVAALRAGQTVQAAREAADQAIRAERERIAGRAATLQADARRLAERYPNLAREITGQRVTRAAPGVAKEHSHGAPRLQQRALPRRDMPGHGAPRHR